MGIGWLVLAAAAIAGYVQGDQTQPQTHNVAVVGGGIGGAFTAYFLWQISQTRPDMDINITIFDSHSALGGRMLEYEHEGQMIELGASMVYAGNAYIRDSLTNLGLKSVSHDNGAGFAVYDGHQVVLEGSPNAFVSLLQLFMRYQLALLRFIWLPLQAFWKFSSIYKMQEEGRYFNTPEDLLRAQGLYEYTQRTFQQLLQDRLGRSSTAALLAEEMIGSVNRCNYNQRNAELHGLVGLISTLPAVDARVFAIQGGNSQLAKRLVTHSWAHVELNRTVQRVSPGPKNIFELTVHSKETNDITAHSFDAVVLATPLSLSKIDLSGFQPALPTVPVQPYTTTITTLVEGVLNISYFGLTGAFDGAMYVTDGADAGFQSISPVAKLPTRDYRKVFKIFSSQPLTDQQLMTWFHQYNVLVAQPWEAYPAYSPPESFAPFSLVDCVAYNNAIETAASAMEMSAIAARNSALLTLACLDKQRLRDTSGTASSS